MEITEAINKIAEWLKKSTPTNSMGMGQPDDLHFLSFALYFATHGGELDGLLAMRQISLWIAKTPKGNTVLRHKVQTEEDKDGWPSEEEYQDWASEVLAPKKDVVLKGLEEATDTASALAQLIGAWSTIAKNSSHWYKAKK